MALTAMSPAIVWFLIGIFMMLLELFIPGLVIIFFGFGALIAGLTTSLGLTNGLTGQMLVFIISSLLSLFLLRRYLAKIFLGKVMDNQDSDFNLDIGKIVPVIKDIDPEKGNGEIKYQGSLWKARAQEKITAGESVKIVGRDNITIIVEKVK